MLARKMLSSQLPKMQHVRMALRNLCPGMALSAETLEVHILSTTIDRPVTTACQAAC